MLRAKFFAAALAAPGIAMAADVVGTITILEGRALIYRGSERLHAAEGVRLEPGDIVATAASSFAQVELADLSVAQFGPATSVMLNVSTSRQKPPGRWLYLMDGWTKLIGTKRSPSAQAGYDFRSAHFEIPANAGVIVLRSASGSVDLFVESGSIRLGERQPPGNAVATVSLKSGDFYQRKFPARGRVATVAPAAFVADMPRAFRDSLPPRIERFRDRPVQPKDALEFSYADVESWLQAEPAIRRPLMYRWRSKARQHAFRAALVTNLRAHPEWDPILFPEKYRPKEPPRATSEPASAAAR